MRIANNPNPRSMVNPAMIVAVSGQTFVGLPFVSKHRGLWQYFFVNEGHHVWNGAIRHYLSDNRSATFNGSDYTSLVVVLLSHAAATAHKSFVNLNATAKRVAILFKHGANLLEHAPRGFVGHSGFPFQLLRRDTAACRGHQKDCMKPSPQRRAGLVVDR